ncbi:unnamed protein product [Owenia fusiformis]|uniref:Ankyrin repeat domain-containing protein 10 n=1 Tax=Owenia fusiformis TaxID=6347 RepID=A0A8S4NAG4_OWEFU|nr:unnamed protein product [Owenia fusiformis]
MAESYKFGYWGSTSEELLKSHFPIHRACRDGDLENLSLLLIEAQHGIYVEDSFYGWTPAHWAAYFGKLNCLMRLLEHGVNCDATTVRFNQSPAHIAAFGGHSHCLKWLLHCGAKLSKQDYLGETPLHKAARTGSLECVSLLTSHGATLDVKNNNGHTPSQVSKNCGYMECSAYLERTMTQYYEKRQHLSGITQDLSPHVNFEQASVMAEKCVLNQAINGGLLPPPAHNGADIPESGHHEDADMDSMETESPETDTHTNGQNGFHIEPMHNGSGDAFSSNGLNGASNHHENGFLPHAQNGHGDARNEHIAQRTSTQEMNGAQSGDIMLHNDVARNCVPIAGKKRSREDVEEEGPKRMRRGDAVFTEPEQWFNPLLFKPVEESPIEDMNFEAQDLQPYESILAVSAEPMTRPVGIVDQMPTKCHAYQCFAI